MHLFPFLVLSAGGVAALFFCVWLLSLRLADTGIVDSFWGPGFVLVAVLGAVAGAGDPARRGLVAVLAGIWGLRLGAHILVRNKSGGEDRRYARMRDAHGPGWGLASLWRVFALQAAILLVVSLPLQVAATEGSRGLGLLDFVGIALWCSGFAFEAVGDLQLSRFKADPASEGRVMDRGLWRFTRHPNYFGDALLWWGFGVIALPLTPWGPVALAGPALMTFLLTRVSGVTLLEGDLARRKPGYADYVSRTNAFFPGPPREAAREG